MKNNIDERTVYESNRIYKRCFYILCCGIFFDLVVKFNLYKFEENTLQTVLAFGIETMLLATVFYVNLFSLAKKGIAFGVSDTELDKFPAKIYVSLSFGIAFTLSVGMWTLRFCTSSWEYGLLSAVLFCTVIYLVTFVLAFLMVYLSFYFSFRVAKKAQNEI